MTVTESLCADPTDALTACRYAEHCSVERRQQQSAAGLRGMRCYAYQHWVTVYPLTGLVKTPEALERESIQGERP